MPPAKPNILTVLAHRDFRLFEISTFLASLSAEILTVAIGWMIYDISRDPFDLGLVGLVQFLPTLLLVLVTGGVADRYPRHTVMALCLVVEFISVFGVFLLAYGHVGQIWPILSLMVLLGIGRAFFMPASSALAPTLVKREEIGAAIACSSASWQLSAIAGPALGGLLYGISADFAYGAALVMVSIAVVCAFLIRPVATKPRENEDMMGSLLGGFRYMRHETVVLGATTLDLVVVLLGTSVVLLPIFTRDILLAGPWELGLLRAGVGIGALAVALYLGVRPIRRHAGTVMFAAVVVFALATIAFGMSTSLWLSVAALIVMGASDMVSVYIRRVLVQLWTPDEVRGRVSAVNSLLVTTSNELGSFRAGSVAGLIGAVPATVLGGFCTLLATALWYWLFARLRRTDDLSGNEGRAVATGE